MNYFKGRKAVLATMHGKEKVIAPLLKELDIEVVVPLALNTDLFGTFTRDIKRAGNQLEAARAKAKVALAITGLDLAIASEGSFGSHPAIPWVQSNLELVLLVDKENDIEIRGHARSSETNANGIYVSSFAEAKKIVKEWGFPKHGLVVRNSENGNTIYKGITTYEELENRIQQLLGIIFRKKVFIETDLRAHMNPTRMKNIGIATEDLLKNMKSFCPKCQCPGFVVIDAKKGLPCGGCGLATDMICSYIYGCQKCKYEEKRLRPDTMKATDPGQCNYCNP